MTHILFRNKRSRSPWLRTAGWRVEAALIYLFWLLVARMHPDQASVTGKWLFRWLGPRTSKQQRIKRNLIIAFPDIGDHQLEMLAREIWGNFGSVLAEYPHLRKFADRRVSTVIKMEIDTEVRPIVEDRKPAVYITAHLANWELAASAIAGTGVPLSVVYAPQTNPLLDRMLQSQRRLPGCRFIGKHNAVRWLVREIRAGRSVGLLPDQRMDSGKSLPFFGLTTPSPTTPAWLALKTGCPLIPVQIERIGDARYRAVFHKPLLVAGEAGDDENILQVTAAINRLFEGWIRHRPDQWLCMKRRWPKLADEIAVKRRLPCA